MRPSRKDSKFKIWWLKVGNRKYRGWAPDEDWGLYLDKLGKFEQGDCLIKSTLMNNCAQIAKVVATIWRHSSFRSAVGVCLQLHCLFYCHNTAGVNHQRMGVQKLGRVKNLDGYSDGTAVFFFFTSAYIQAWVNYPGVIVTVCNRVNEIRHNRVESIIKRDWELWAYSQHPSPFCL